LQMRVSGCRVFYWVWQVIQSHAKTVTIQMTFIDRVSCRSFMSDILSKLEVLFYCSCLLTIELATFYHQFDQEE
jgi:hypothetical protein